MGASAPEAARSLVKIEAPLTSFRAYRRLEAVNQRFKKHGWMDVVTELADGRVLTVEVIAEGGSPVIRNRVLRPVLDGERQLLATGDSGRTALSTENYAVVGETAQGTDGLQLMVKALRREITLVDGTVDVTRQDHDLVQVAGRLAKSPSFWVSRVEVVRRYARIGGVRVPVQVESTAHVRLAGPSAMTMTYRYETINGVPCDDH